jgi:hypothetical protein
MDEVSVTRSPNPALTSIVADAGLCKQVAHVLGIEEETVRRAFIGEPVEVVLAMAGWVLSHEWDDGFDAGEVLPAWAERRGRGAWSGRPVQASRNGGERNGEPTKRELAVEIARY